MNDLKLITEMNKQPLQMHVMNLLSKENHQISQSSLFLAQAAQLITDYWNINQNSQQISELIENLPCRSPQIQMAILLGSSDKEKQTEEQDYLMTLQSLEDLTDRLLTLILKIL